MTIDEMIANMVSLIRNMSGEDIAFLWNQNFGSGIVYLGDDEFKQNDLVACNYENGECPDCGELIGDKTSGDSCENCDHVFCEIRDNDD